MPVGNDIVDLRDPGSQPEAIHPRFDSRVFTADERRHLDEASPADRHVLRWTLWAAKESALKLVRQQDESVPFHPRSFEVQLRGDGSAIVTFAGSPLQVSIDVTTERVHAVSWLDVGARPVSGVDQPARCPVGKEASRLVRTEAARAVGQMLDIPAREVEIEGRIPRALRNGRRLPVDLSLSHHGRFLAHAILGLALVIVGCSSSTEPESALAAAQARWSIADPGAYTFDYNQSCFCGFTGPIRITVEGGVVTAAETLPGGPLIVPDLQALPTIDDLFLRLEAAVSSDPVVYEVEFDSSRGFPVSANVDISLQIADEEFYFEVENVADL